MPGNQNNGRDSTLTPEVQAKIIGHVRNGTPQKYAAAAAGIKEGTLKAWVNKGRKGDNPLYVNFVNALKDAFGEFVSRNVQIIQDAADGVIEETVKETTGKDGTPKIERTTRRVFEWTAAAWLLERRSQEEFSNAKAELQIVKKQLIATNEKLEALLRVQSQAPLPEVPASGVGSDQAIIIGREDDGEE